MGKFEQNERAKDPVGNALGHHELELDHELWRAVQRHAYTKTKRLPDPATAAEQVTKAPGLAFEQQGDRLLVRVKVRHHSESGWNAIMANMMKHLDVSKEHLRTGMQHSVTHSVGIGSDGVSQAIGDTVMSFMALAGGAEATLTNGKFDEVAIAFSLSPIDVKVGGDGEKPRFSLTTSFDVIQPYNGETEIRASAGLKWQITKEIELSARVVQNLPMNAGDHPDPILQFGLRARF